MDDGSPELAVGFVIETGDSFARLERLYDQLDRGTVEVLKMVAQVEKATGGMIKVEPAIANIQSIANASTRAEQDIRRAKAQTEKAGEALIRTLDREADAFGRTRSEMRLARADALALAAAQQGNTDLASRLTASASALYDKQFAAARKAAQEAQALAEDRAVAAQRAVAATEAEAQAVRSAALAYNMFEAAAKRGMAAYKEQVAAAASAAKQAAAIQAQADAEAAVNAQLLERARIQAALERTTGAGRMAATDNGASYSALAAKAAEDEAREAMVAAAAAKQLADEHQRLAAMVQDSHDAQVADAAAAERLREATDPLYSVTKRLNAEIAESTRLYHSGATAPEEYARQQEVLNQRLSTATTAHNAMTSSLGKSSFAMKNFAIQIPDVVQGLASGQAPMTIFIQQGGQIAQIAMMAEGGIAGFATELGGLLIAAAPVIGVLAAVGAGFALFDRSVSKGIDTTAMVNSLGLTRDEIKRLKDTTVSTGDVVTATFEVIAQRIGFDMGNVKKFFGDAMDFMTKVGADALAGLYAGFVGTFDAIGVVIRDLKAGKAGDILGDINKDMAKRFDQARGALNRFGADVTKQIKNDKLAALQKQANELKLDRTPKKPKVDHHAEQLARDAAAIEAQIKNLYALADAYGQSGAAALIAEAREKAESKAIKQRGDIAAETDRQIRLAVAQRVADAAKSTAAMNDQFRLQQQVNAEVAAGNVPAARAGDLLRDRIEDLPLLAALEAAQTLKGKEGAAAVEKAAAALDAQRAARDKLTDSERAAQLLAAKSAGADQLAEMQRELELIGATDAARTHALATLRAEQEALANGWTGAKGAEWVAQQVQIADTQVQLKLRTDAANDSLNYQADLLGIIADSAQRAAQGMADAFGHAGEALGNLTADLAGYLADQKQLSDRYKDQIKLAGQLGTEEDRTRAIREATTKYNLKSGAAQIGLYGDMASAAKGFFSENSAGYKALQAAEQVYRVAQLAMSVAAIFQDTAETTAHVANAAARASADGAAGIAAQAKLPFPANLAAMAATAAALVALGVTIFGGHGGSGGHVTAPPTSEDMQKAAGTGTILGSPLDKSASIANSLKLVADNTSDALSFSNEMLSSLKSIDASIGAMAATVAKQINVSGSLFDTTKLNLGSSGSAGFLGLFSSSTTRSLYDAGISLAATTVGNIVANGIAGQTYQIVQQVKKKSGFLGIGGGTKTTYSTTTGGLPADVATSIQSVIGALENGIVTAAGSIGIDGAKAMLDNFQVSIGKVSFNGLDAQGIEDQLNAIFSSVGDQMVGAIMPGITKFQKVGEGLFETLERVASTVVAVDAEFKKLGRTSTTMGIDIDMAVADMFDSVSDFTSAADAYFSTYYSTAEQTAAQTAEMQKVFASLNLAMPDTLAAFRQLVDAQDLSTASGQAAYATLLKIAPAFADLQQALNGAKSAADAMSERQDLMNQLWQLQGDTASIRAAQLASLDPSNRALQEQIYAIQDAQDAAKAAQSLADAWTSVGTSIMDEVKRIRGLNDSASGGSFASLMGQFNAATAAARGGDQGAAKSLPQLSQDLLSAAALVATSRQELDRIQAQTAASLEATYAAIMAAQGNTVANVVSGTSSSMAVVSADTLGAIGAAQPAPPPANDDLIAEIRSLRDEVAQLRSDNNSGHAATAGNTGAIKRKLDDVTADSGGTAISTVAA